ncbi:winged helix-turn-helix domain-containing protein [Kordiimonas aestuarii]|uniref:winged helix-turn-helix domain-containing protein n=1 Tax=Kordiimonas aestuarii TaxID=1005925 RepID=UPI0021D19B82|nr:transcriptional regulator [Kordiimonas aestuarii]
MSDFDYRTINDVIHSRVRLAIMSYLASARAAEFTELKKVLKVSDGNLSTHLKKLEDHAYVKTEKGFVGRKPQTMVEITDEGSKAFRAYVEGIASMLGQS